MRRPVGDWLVRVAAAAVLGVAGCSQAPIAGPDVPPPTTRVATSVDSSAAVPTASPSPSASGTPATPPPATPSVPPKDTRRGKGLNRPFVVDGVIVVSADHRLGAGYRPKVTGPAQLTAAAAKAYAALTKALRKTGGALHVVSSYRSHAQQQALRNSSLRRYGRAYTVKYVARPGTSEHQTGLAVDLSSPSGRGPTFDKTKEWRWLRSHAQDYGFVLRYPKGATKITGIGYEPWHWRYVGVSQARAIRALGANVTLEQYLGLD